MMPSLLYEFCESEYRSVNVIGPQALSWGESHTPDTEQNTADGVAYRNSFVRFPQNSFGGKSVHSCVNPSELGFLCRRANFERKLYNDSSHKRREGFGRGGFGDRAYEAMAKLIGFEVLSIRLNEDLFLA